jgi:hypothetical protein
MVISAEFFGLVLLVTSAAALGLSIVVDVGKYTAEKTKTARIARQIERKRQSLADWSSKAEKKLTELRQDQAALAELLGRKNALVIEIKGQQIAKVELVHEIGETDNAAMSFYAQLATVGNFAQIDRHDIVFSRQIWDYKNVVHVWANSTEHALALVNGAFGPRTGLQATPLLPLSFVGDGTPRNPS